MGEYARDEILKLNGKLKALLLRHMEKPGLHPDAIKGLTLVRREAVNSSEQCFSRPLVSVVVQGRKHSSVGNMEYDIHENQCLVSGVDVPSVSYAVAPSSENPFLSIFFYLDGQMLSNLIMEMANEDRPVPGNGKGVLVADVEPEFLETLLRLVELLDKPGQIVVRAPMIFKELHYLLLIGPQGSVLSSLYMHGTRNNNVVQAISFMKRNIST